jgi:hypothetical protein
MNQLILGAFAGVVSAAIDRTRRKLRGERPLAKANFVVSQYNPRG